MRCFLVIVSALALVPFAALAQTTAPAPPPAPAPAPAAEAPPSAPITTPAAPSEPAPAPAPAVTETLRVGEARGVGMFEQGVAAGGYSMPISTSTNRMTLFGNKNAEVRTNFRFLGLDGAQRVKGLCSIRAQGGSFFGVKVNNRNAQVYKCELERPGQAGFALEVALPAFNESGFSFGGFSMTASEDFTDPAIRGILAARMVYDGVTYEARPSGFDDNASEFARRVVKGFTITRNGEVVGGVKFGKDDAANPDEITAPTTAEAGREAVVFFAMQLMVMPDLYSDRVRSELQGE